MASSQAARELFVDGLKNIHAIQRDAKAMMEKVIDRLDHYPEARQRLIAHLGDKNHEMERAEQLLDKFGEQASGVKDSAMALMGSMTANLTGAADDDVLKSSMLTYGLAHYEIAAYESLIELATPAGCPEARPVLETSLAEEKAMAGWLHDHLRPTLDRYLELKEQGAKAAH